jgi:hypothetical protein
MTPDNFEVEADEQISGNPPTASQTGPKSNADKRRSKNSMASSTGSQNGRNGREISETFSNKMYEMKWCIFALICNIVLLLFVLALPGGLIVDLSKSTVAMFGCVCFEIVLLITNIISVKALDDGFQAYFGNVLSAKGVSMAICGFAQTRSFLKMTYASELSLNSSVRKILVRLSYFWIIIEALKLLTPVPATSLIYEVVKADFGQTDCIEFTQSGILTDRQWPNMEVEAGVAELIFGASIGNLRSQIAEPLNATTAVIGPQLLGAVNDGDTIVGMGFTADIVTKCNCSPDDATMPGINATDFVSVGVTSSIAGEMADRVNKLNDVASTFAMAVAIENGKDHVNITTVLVNTAVCGGLNVYSQPVCKTTISNHRFAEIEMTYMTDGTPASIAQEFASIREIKEGADIETWLYKSMVNIFEGEMTDYQFPPTVSGMLTPLMYWTSSDLVAINVAMMESGIETFFTILLRSAIQRTYGSKGARCTRNVIVESQAMLRIKTYGGQSAIVALVIQLVFAAFSAAAFLPWFLNKAPAGPAIRAVKESVYFTTLLADSNFSDNLRGLCNAPTFAIWQGLDIVVRVGESVESMDDEVGHITMDKPKLVRPLTNGRRYV